MAQDLQATSAGILVTDCSAADRVYLIVTLPSSNGTNDPATLNADPASTHSPILTSSISDGPCVLMCARLFTLVHSRVPGWNLQM